jgi:hypothetical protein
MAAAKTSGAGGRLACDKIVSIYMYVSISKVFERFNVFPLGENNSSSGSQHCPECWNRTLIRHP